jgi:hypothetical protein
VEIQFHVFLVLALGRSGQQSASASSYPETMPLYPVYRRLGGPKRRSGCFGDEINVAGMEPGIIRCPSCSLVAIPTELTQRLRWVGGGGGGGPC